MKIAISANGKDLEAQIDPRFGRCAYFIIVDTDSMNFEVFDNESISLGGGAGIQAAQFVASKGAEVIITGNCGPNAVKTLTAAGVKLIVGQDGPVGQAVNNYISGNLKSTDKPNVIDHHGMGGGSGMGGSTSQNAGEGFGMGRGMGRGMGKGMGRGMGSGGGISRGAGMEKQSFQSASANGNELIGLKEQITSLQKQIETFKDRIEKLENK